MNLRDMNELLGLVANLGVIAGIVFLAVEISQNTTAIRADIYQTRAFEVASSNDLRAESTYITPLFESVRGDHRKIDIEKLNQLSQIDRERLWLATEGIIRRYDNNLYQCSLGYLEAVFCRESEIQTRDRFGDWQKIAQSVGTQVNPAFRLIYETLD